MAINTGHGFDLGPIPDNWRDLARCAKVDASPTEATEMSHRVCEQEFASISLPGTPYIPIDKHGWNAMVELYTTDPLLKLLMANAERQAKKMIDNLATPLFGDASLDWGPPVLISIDPVSGLDVRNVDIWSDQSGPVDGVSSPGGLGPIVYPNSPYVPDIPVTLNMLNHADAILQAHGATVVDGELVAAIYRAMAAHAPDAIDRAKSMPSGSAMINALCDEVAAKDARIAELKSELARRPAAFVDPDEKPEHNPFREFTKDRRRMGP